MPDRSLPLAAISLRIATGSRDDPAGRSGLAHLLEHLMFGGTRRHRRGEHLQVIQAWGGYVNARASTDWTKFEHVVSPDLVAAVLELETERFLDTDAGLTPENLAAEKKVVLRERLHRMTNVAYGTALEQLVGLLYTDGSPYGRLPIGLDREVPAITVADCRHHYRAHYVGPRVTLTIVGDIEPDRLVDAIGRLTSVFAANPAPQPAESAAVRQARRHDVATPRRTKLYLGYPLPSAADQWFDLARLTTFALGRSPGGRLPERLIRRHRLAASVTVKTLARQHGASVGLIELVPAEGVPAEAALAGLDDAIAEPLTDAEVQRAKAGYRTAWLTDLDSIVERGDGLSLALQLHGGTAPYLRHEAKMSAVEPADLSAAMRYWWPANRRAELVHRHA